MLRGLQNVLRGPVVLLQAHHLGVRVVPLEGEDVPDIGVAPRVDRLVGVAHHTDVAVLAGQKLGEGVLDHVGVLELVDHEVQVAVLVLPQHLRCLLKEPDGLQQQVIEIQRLAPGEEPLVPLIHPLHDLLVVAAHRFRVP